ncbi:hypothetical protein [Colwellia maritima]|nr:hypothetical protein [Colwellia maritima]
MTESKVTFERVSSVALDMITNGVKVTVRGFSMLQEEKPKLFLVI